MFLFLLTVIVLALWVYQLVLASRLKSEGQLRESDLASMKRRLWSLEEQVCALRPEPEPVPAAVPSVEPPVFPVAPPIEAVAPVTVPETIPPVSPAPLVFAEEAPKPGWEAALGGNWLNKIGVLVLVIGLALFIGWSFTWMGPGGRVALSLAVSVSMLAGGVALERREKYRIFARGLIGGGWSALYSTVFAAHALEAARVVPDPLVATLLLAAVAMGMILHSFRYRSQAVTGVAFFVAFITLALTKLSFFAVIALVPLAVSLLFVAHRFRWTAVALAGLPATYGIYFLHAVRSSGGSLAAAQTLLFVYWLVFEAFDLVDHVQPRRPSGASAPVFPLNAIAFTLVSVVQWQTVSPGNLYLLFVLAAAAYFGSALARWRLRSPATFSETESAADRLRMGGYEGAITLTAVFTAVAIALKLSGLSMTIALLVEAELIFLAGLQLRQSFLRHLATGVFTVASLRMLAVDVPSSKRLAMWGAEWRAWSPVALLQVGVFYFNRIAARGGAYYSSVAAALLLLVFGFELPLAYLGLSWLLLALVLLELSFAWKLRDFSIQSWVAGGAGLVTLLYQNVALTPLHGGGHGWLPQLCGAVVLYAVATRIGVRADRRPTWPEEQAVRHAASTVGTVLAAALLLNVLAAEFVGLAWLLLALALYEYSLAAKLREFGVQGYLAGFASLLMLVAKNVITTGLHTDWHGWVPQLLAAVVLYAAAVRMEALRDRHWNLTLQSTLRDLLSVGGTLLSAAFLANVLPDSMMAIGWAALGLALLVVGSRYDCLALRVQSYALALVTFGRTWIFNLSLEGHFAGLPVSVLTAAGVIAGLYAAELLTPRRSLDSRGTDPFQRAEAYARLLFSWLGTFLLAILLFHEVSGRMLTVAWGVQGLALLFAGFPLRERAMRLAGLCLLLVCVLKLFVYDLSSLDMPFRVLSFLVLGVILIGVSFFYSRFRERISRYL